MTESFTDIAARWRAQHAGPLAEAARRLAAGETKPEQRFDPAAWRTERAAEVLEKTLPRRFATATTDRPEIADWVARFVADPAATPSLLLIGPVGVGKTHAGYAALRGAVLGTTRANRGIWWRATTHSDLNAAVRPKPDDSHVHALTPFLEADIVLIDDLSAGLSSTWTDDVLLRVVDHRWQNCKPLIVTSNCLPADFSKVVGERVASRLADSVKLAFKGADLRRTPRGER